jgi:uncharacterized XkdX family phage protein
LNWYATIERYYNAGYYNDDPTSTRYVGNFVEAGKITEEQYKTITGSETYTPPQAV